MRTYVITGASSGIGRQAALMLAADGTHLELLGRDARRGKEVVGRIGEQNPGCRVRFHQVELSDLDQVRRVATDIASAHDSISGILNNAGARNDRYSATANGTEKTFGANHLAHFMLTCLLLDRLLEGQCGRVINVASSSHMSATSVNDWMLSAAAYDRRQAYARSKLANVMFSYELAKRMSGTRVVSNAIDPGNVATRFARNNGLVAWAKHLISHTMRGNLVSSATAAASLVRLASEAEFAALTGRYFQGDTEARSSAASYDSEAWSRLWEKSVQLTGLDATNCRAWSYVRPRAAG